MSSRYYTKRIFKKRPKGGIRPASKPNAFRSEASAREWAARNSLKDFKVDQIADKKFKIREYF
jgi:hypothetical protein